MKKVKISGIIFHIKKINPMDHIDGSKVLMKTFVTYEEKRAAEKAKPEPDKKAMEKTQSHMADVILAGTVKPKITRTPEDEGTCIEELFDDWELAGELYNEILSYTWGKKKVGKFLKKQ
ncbi:MAG: hypothetical protein HKM92_08580 [Arenibacter sp.]|nr:hypothetical protein [Arenibacter sp.]